MLIKTTEIKDIHFDIIMIISSYLDIILKNRQLITEDSVPLNTLWDVMGYRLTNDEKIKLLEFLLPSDALVKKSTMTMLQFSACKQNWESIDSDILDLINGFGPVVLSPLLKLALKSSQTRRCSVRINQ